MEAALDMQVVSDMEVVTMVHMVMVLVYTFKMTAYFLHEGLYFSNKTFEK